MGRLQGDLLGRSFQLARNIIELGDCFPSKPAGWVLSKQLIRSGTSVGANLREADHALTDAEFVHRCSIARNEASETSYWLELARETGLLGSETVEPIFNEAIELTRILASVVIKTQRHLSKAN